MTDPVRILALDGGGVRGLSSLLILKDLAPRLQSMATKTHEKQYHRPCNLFDMICGSGTGGLIAMMLGKMGMVYSATLTG
jgi:patatin-like phospholipase/acyl hydrolase